MQTSARRIQRAWRALSCRRLSSARREMRETWGVCVVCGEECVQMVRCSRNHGCCTGCTVCSTDASKCPVCREARPAVVDPLLPLLMEALGPMRFRCAACGEVTGLRERERHRAWCPAHEFVCPWQSCSHCARGADMAAHVRGHEGVVEAEYTPGGSHHATVALRAGESQVFTTATGMTVVLSLLPSPRAASVQLTLRAYYPSAESPALLGRVRQVVLPSCEWVEDHRTGVVPAMISSRESVVLGAAVAITPRSAWSESVHTLLHPGRPSALAARRAGLREVVLPSSPLSPPTAMPTVAWLHVELCEDGHRCVSDVINV